MNTKVLYSSFDDAVSMVFCLCWHCFLTKLDIKHSFRLCPVHPKDWNPLGYQWKDRYFFDIVLPLLIFNTFVALLDWILSYLAFIRNFTLLRRFRHRGENKEGMSNDIKNN